MISRISIPLMESSMYGAMVAASSRIRLFAQKPIWLHTRIMVRQFLGPMRRVPPVEIATLAKTTATTPEASRTRSATI